MAKKSPLRGTGRNVGNTDSVPDRDAPNSPSYRFTRMHSFFDQLQWLNVEYMLLLCKEEITER